MPPAGRQEVESGRRPGRPRGVFAGRRRTGQSYRSGWGGAGAGPADAKTRGSRLNGGPGGKQGEGFSSRSIADLAGGEATKMITPACRQLNPSALGQLRRRFKRLARRQISQKGLPQRYWGTFRKAHLGS